MHQLRILERDPDLLGAVPPAEEERLRQGVLAKAASVPPGRCKRRLYAMRKDAPLGVLIMDGFLLQRTCVRERRSIEVLGPTDVSRPWVEGEHYSLPVEVEWEAVTEVELAHLDHSLAEAMAPAGAAIADVLADRLVRRSRWLVLELAIASSKGVDTRLLLTLWHLADRWGSVTPEGVTVPVPLTHEKMAEIVGARRPSISTAFGALSERGLVSRHDQGWILHGPPPIDLPSLDDEAVVTE